PTRVRRRSGTSRPSTATSSPARRPRIRPGSASRQASSGSLPRHRSRPAGASVQVQAHLLPLVVALVPDVQLPPLVVLRELLELRHDRVGPVDVVEDFPRPVPRDPPDVDEAALAGELLLEVVLPVVQEARLVVGREAVLRR